MSSLPLLADSLAQSVKAARLDILCNLPVPSIRSIFFDSLQKRIQLTGRQFNQCLFDFFDAHI